MPKLTPLPFVGKLTASLSHLESLFIEAFRRRDSLWPSNWRDIQLDEYQKAARLVEQKRIYDVLKAEAYKTADQVQAEFLSLLAAADEHLKTVRRLESVTQSYADYMRDLSGLAPLVGVMKESVLISRINGCIHDGRIPTLRAYKELAEATYGNAVPDPATRSISFDGSPELLRALLRAADLVVSEDETNSLQFGADLKAGYKNWNDVRGHLLGLRVDQALLDGDFGRQEDYRAGNYSPGRIFSGSAYF